MDYVFLSIALVLSWISLVVGLYQRIFKMPKWFAEPPSSFELIRRQSKGSRLFWIPLSAFFFISVLATLILNWQRPLIRSHIIMAIVSYAISGMLGGMYFIKEIIAFTKMPADSPATPQLLKRVRFWNRWTTVRDLLQILTTCFITIAFLHF